MPSQKRDLRVRCAGGNLGSLPVPLFVGVIDDYRLNYRISCLLCCDSCTFMQGYLGSGASGEIDEKELPRADRVYLSLKLSRLPLHPGTEGHGNTHSTALNSKG